MFMNTAFDNVCFKGSVVSQSAKFVYLCLCKHADNTHQTCFPSLKRISEIVGKSLSTIKRAVRELLKYGAIERTPRYRKDGGQTSNLYKIKECNFDEIINDFQKIDHDQLSDEEANNDDISFSVTTENESAQACASEGEENIIEDQLLPTIENINSISEKLSNDLVQEVGCNFDKKLNQKNSLSKLQKTTYKNGFMLLIKRLCSKLDSKKSKNEKDNELGGGHGRPSRNLSS